MDDLHENLHLIAFKFFEKDRGLQLPPNCPEVTSFATERRRTGRYTLEEAALFVALNSRARASSVLDSMLDAIARRLLPIYQPFSDEVYSTDIVRPWRDEVFGDAMDDWLEANHPKIGRIFCEPGDKATIGGAKNSFDEPRPGKLPRVAIGRLAVKAAMEIERTKKRSASAKEVLKKLKDWAEKGDEGDVLIGLDEEKVRVIWRTRRGLEKSYGLDACEKTLFIWEKTRR